MYKILIKTEVTNFYWENERLFTLLEASKIAARIVGQEFKLEIEGLSSVELIEV